MVVGTTQVQGLGFNTLLQDPKQLPILSSRFIV